MPAFTFGADPELFIKKGRTFIPAENADGPLIPGTKEEPFVVKGGAIQVDGVATEFNIDPSETYRDFFGNIRDVVGELKDRIKKIDADYYLSPTPTARFSQRVFDSIPEKAKELGCEPDFDAYTLSVNPRPQTDKPIRTGGGHVAIGWANDFKIGDVGSEAHMLDCQLVSMQLDRFLFTASLDWDDDNERRELYGKKGSFRPKPFGMEYRPLSNAWVKSPDTIRAVFNISQSVIQGLDSGKLPILKPGEKENIDWDKQDGDTNTEKVSIYLGRHR